MPVLTNRQAENVIDLIDYPHGYQLKADVSIWLEPLTFGVVKHGLFLNLMEGERCLLSREPGVLTTRAFLVDTGLLLDGEILTAVFNFSNRRARIQKGDVVSRVIPI